MTAVAAAAPSEVTTAITPSRQIPIVCPGHTRPLSEVSFLSLKEDSEDSNNTVILVSACHDKVPMLRDGHSGDWIGSFQGHKGATWSCRLDNNGHLAATASGDFSVKVWDAITGRELYTFAHKHIVKTTEFSPDSRRLATGGHEGLLRIYTLLTPEEEPTVANLLEGGDGDNKKVVITKVVWLDNATVVASGSDGKIRLFQVGEDSSAATPRLLQTLSVDAEVRDMELKRLHDRTNIVMLTVAAGNRVSFFDVSDATTTCPMIKSHQVPLHYREEGGVSLHPSGTKFVTGGSDLWVRVFDFESGHQLECLKGHHGPVRCVRYAPDGRTYATGSEDGTIRLWKTDPATTTTQSE